MFFLRKPTPADIESFLASQRKYGFSYPEVGATLAQLPAGYTHDHNRVELGRGAGVYRRACEALRSWQMFKLVAAMFRHFGFWSLNSARVIYVFSEDRRFGFAYGTLPDHAEQGEERFSIEWSADDDVVFYDILAFSRPRQWPARLAPPIARALQRKFVRDSKAVMVRVVMEVN